MAVLNRRSGSAVLAIAALICVLCGQLPCIATRGTVILEGNELKPPFVIETIHGELCFNGLHPKHPPPPPPIAPSAEVLAMGELMHTVFHEADSLRGRVPDSIVIARAIARCKAEPLVDSVRRSDDIADIKVWWHGRPDPIYVDLVSRREPPISPGESKRIRATSEALNRRSVCEVLQGDGAVIIGGGRMKSTGGRKSVLAEFNAIRNGLPSTPVYFDSEEMRAQVMHPVPLEWAPRYQAQRPRGPS